jgi:hypothetical protein
MPYLLDIASARIYNVLFVTLTLLPYYVLERMWINCTLEFILCPTTQFTFSEQITCLQPPCTDLSTKKLVDSHIAVGRGVPSNDYTHRQGTDSALFRTALITLIHHTCMMIFLCREARTFSGERNSQIAKMQVPLV